MPAAHVHIGTRLLHWHLANVRGMPNWQNSGGRKVALKTISHKGTASLIDKGLSHPQTAVVILYTKDIADCTTYCQESLSLSRLIVTLHA